MDSIVEKILNGLDVHQTISEALLTEETVTVGLYGDEVPGCFSVNDVVDYFKNEGFTVTNVSGNMEHGWEMNVSGQPRDLFFAICNVIPGYNCDSVQDFIDEYRIDESKSLVEAEDLNSNKKFDLVDCFGYKALYTPNRFRVDGPVDGVRLYAYDVKSLPDDPDSFGTLENHVLQGRNGSLLFLKSIRTPVDIHNDISFTGDELSVPEFIAVYGSKKRTA